MCNLYSMTTNVEAIRRLFQVDASNDKTGNLPAMPGIYPDYPAPIVRNGKGGRELAMARWGMPSSQKALMDATKKRAEKLQAKGKTVDFTELLRMEPDSGTTNIRNVKSQHWTRWLGAEFKNLFSALQLRRLDCASSAAVVIDMAGPSNSSMVDSPNHLSDDG